MVGRHRSYKCLMYKGQVMKGQTLTSRLAQLLMMWTSYNKVYSKRICYQNKNICTV